MGDDDLMSFFNQVDDGLGSLLTALTDETIQMFSDGRSSQLTDVWLDLSGAMAGILVGLFCLALCRMCWLLYKHRNED